MRSEIMFPSQCALIPQVEMTYLSGGTDASGTIESTEGDGEALVILGIAGAVVIASTFIAVQIGRINDARVRTKYEKTYGISAYDPDGFYTTDFMNYKSRMQAQGRDNLSTIANWTCSLFSIPLGLSLTLGMCLFLIASSSSS